MRRWIDCSSVEEAPVAARDCFEKLRLTNATTDIIVEISQNQRCIHRADGAVMDLLRRIRLQPATRGVSTHRARNFVTEVIDARPESCFEINNHPRGM